MPKTKNSRNESHDEPELDISSLIDVSFLLLIFFIVTSTLMKTEFDLPLTLPGDPEERMDPAPEPLQITIAADGSVIVGGQVMAGPSEAGEISQIAEVRAQLKEHRMRAELLEETPRVSLTASDEANGQRFIDVINALAYADIQHIAMQNDFAAN